MPNDRPEENIPARNYVKWNKRRKFGIELEYLNDNTNLERLRDAITSVDDQHCDIRGWEHTIDNYGLWIAKTDSSCGLEVCTPPMSGPNDLKTLGKVVDSIRENSGARFDDRCGLHVHICLDDFTFNQMCTLLMYWIKIETVVMNSYPGHRRENRYCRPLNDQISTWHINQRYTPNEIFNAFHRYRGALNTNYWENRRILEWRMGDMSMDAEDVKNRVRFLIWFVDIAKIMPIPDNLNWFSSKQTMRFLGLLPCNNDLIQKTFSPAVKSMRRWILERLDNHLPDYYQVDKELVKEMIDEVETETHFPTEHL